MSKFLIKTGSKLAIHANKVTDALFTHIEQAAAQGTPFSVVKLTQEFTGLHAVKARSPETLTVARAVAPHDGMQGVVDISDADVEAWADQVLAPLYQFSNDNPDFQEYIDVWELINEADPVGDRGYLMLGKVLRQCMQKASADFPGVVWGVGSCNMGTPEYSEMQAFAESGVFDEEDVVLCLHEGVQKPADPINKWHSTESDHPDAGSIPGASSVPPGGGALFGRVAYWHQILGEERMPPVIITEAYLHAYGDNAEIRRRAEWVDALYSQMWFVVGWCPFTHSPTNRWKDQDYTPAYPELTAFMSTVANRENASRSATVVTEPAPPPPPPPQPTGQLIDLRRFKIAHPDCWRVVKHVRPDGHETGQDVQDMQLGNGLFVRRKNQLAEWHRVDEQFFYLVHDTSPDVGSEGIPRVYTLFKDSRAGAPKSKLQQQVGEEWVEDGKHRVQFRARDDCRELAENSGNAQNRSKITRYERNYTFNTYGQNLTFEEVIWEKTGVETQIYGRMNGKSCGWIGWEAPWGSSEPVEVHWDRGRLTQEPDRVCGW